MNALKSLYMLLAPLTLMAVIVYAIYQLVASPFDFAWVAVLLTALPLMVFLMGVMIFQNKPRTHDYLPVHSLVVALGMAMILVLFIIPSLQSNVKLNTMSLVLAEISTAIYILYLFWYSSLGRVANTKLALGRALPEFKVYDEDQEINSASFKGKPLVLIFYRGNWCPFCVAQIKELAKDYQELSLQGVKFLLISPQPEYQTKAIAKKFNVPFTFLSDLGNFTAKQLGIYHKNGLPTGMNILGYNSDTVYPTVIVTNSKGEVIYLNETNSFRDRPDPMEYLPLIADKKAA